MKNLMFFLFVTSFSLSFGQAINGFVFDTKTNKPIKGAHVYISTIEQGTTTNLYGKFRLKLSGETVLDSIYVSHIGYKKKGFPYTEKKKKYLIYLETNNNQLSEVQIRSTPRQLNSRLRYNKLTSMKKGLHSFGSILKDNKIYVVGGNVTYKLDNKKKAFQEVQPEDKFGDFLTALNRRSNFSKEFYRGDLLVYDLDLDVWEVADVKFRERAHHNLHFHNNKLYVLGGKFLSMGRKYEYLDDKIEVFNSKDNTIQIDNTNPHQAVDFASFKHGDKIIVMGGAIKMKKNGKKILTDKVHLFDLKTGFWYEMASMPSPKEASGVLIDTTIYIMGRSNEKTMASIEVFDLVSGKWNKEGELFEGFTKPAVTHNNHVIYMFENGKVATYNMKTKELNQYSIDLDLQASKLYYANNKLYVLGGFRENNYSTLPSGDLFSIDINEFGTTKINKSKRL